MNFLALASVYAHIKWFVPVEDIIEHEELTFSIYDPVVIAWIGIILALLLIGLWLENALKVPSKFLFWVKAKKQLIIRLFQIMLGLFFILVAYDNEVIAPIFVVNDFWSEAMRWMEFLLGIILIFDVFVWFGAFVLMLLGLIASFKWGFIEIFDHLHLLGVAMYLFVVKHPKKNFAKEFNAWALPLLRVLTGLTLIILAFSEKLLHPELGLEFLKTHDWNFVNSFGMEWFSNYIFVVSAGATEFVLGLFLVLGLLTRITTIVLAIFMLSTALILGPHEVLGHLPIFAIAILFLAYGSGKKLKVINK